MNYAETLDYLFTRLPMFSRIGAAAYKADLTNTIRLSEYIGNPHLQFKSIHIAGTNGKGSTSHMLASILQTAGYKTGLYTSPHLYDFRERFRIDGEMMSEQFIIEFTEKIKPAIDEIEPSFFEITVAMAFEWFAINHVDIAIIETGLGGRLDSTNIIIPELSIITNIGYDHMNLLGDTLEKIAAEKAGIIKPNVPVIIGEHLPETLPVFSSTAIKNKARLILAQDQHSVTDWHWEKNRLVVETASLHSIDHEQYQLDLPGIYQRKNLLTVLAAVETLNQKGWNISSEQLRLGLQHTKKNTGLHGRWEIVNQSPLMVLDVAHNEDGIKQVLEQIEMITHRELHIVIGMVNDKEIDKVLELLPKHARYYFTKAPIPRALPEVELCKKADAKGLKGKAFTKVELALVSAATHAHRDDLILVCGSIFLVAEVTPAVVNAVWGRDGNGSHSYWSLAEFIP